MLAAASKYASPELGFGSVVGPLGLGVDVGKQHLGENFHDERLESGRGGAHDCDVDFDAGPDGY